MFLDKASANGIPEAAEDPRELRDTSGNSRVLTDREEEVLRLVAHGYTNKEIAWRVSVSVKSVETYKSRATNKLELHSRAQIVEFAIRHGWMYRTQ